MPEQYLFELVLQSRDEASPTVEKLRTELAALQAALQVVGAQAQATGAAEVQATTETSRVTKQGAADLDLYRVAQRELATELSARRGAEQQLAREATEAAAQQKQAAQEAVAARRQAAQDEQQAEREAAALRAQTLADAKVVYQQQVAAEVAAEQQQVEAAKQRAQAITAQDEEQARAEADIRARNLADAKAVFAQQVEAEKQAEQEGADAIRTAQQSFQAELTARKQGYKEAADAAKTAAAAEKQAAAEVAAAEKAAAEAEAAEAAQRQDALGTAGRAVTAFTQGIAQGFGVLVPLSVAAATAAVVRFGVDSAKNFGEFERGMREVVTITGQSGKEAEDTFSNLSEQIRQFSVEMGVNATDATHAFYEILSSGVNKPTDAMQVLTVAAKAAVGGVTDLHTAADAIVGALNAYHLSADQAAHVSDVLFSAVKDGRIRWDELGRSLGLVFPTAAQVGVSIEEVSAALAAMSNEGVVSQTAMIQLNQVLTSVIKPSKEAQAAAADMKLEWSVAALQAKGLVGFLDDLNKATGGNAEQIARLVPEIRGMRGVWELTGDSLVRLKEYTDNANNSLGNTQRAADQVNESGGRAFDRFNAQLAEVNRTIGEKLLPSLEKTLTFIDLVGQHLGAWPTNVPNGEQLARFEQLDQSATHTAAALSILGKELSAVWQGIEAGKTPQQSLIDLFIHESTFVENATNAISAHTAAEAAGETASLKDAAAIMQAAAAHQAAEDAAKKHTTVVKEQTDAERNYQEILGNIQKAQDAGIYTQKQADDARARAKADLEKATKAAADSQSDANRDIAENLRLVAAGTVSAHDFGASLIGVKDSLKDLTQQQFEEKLKEIANALAFGSISAADAEAQIKAVTDAYNRVLDEAVRKAEENAKQIDEANKTAAEDDKRFRDTVTSQVRDGYEKIKDITQKSEVEIQTAIRDSDDAILKIRGKASDDQIKEEQTFVGKMADLVKQRTDLETGSDEASQQERLKVAQANDEFRNRELQAQQKHDDDTVTARREANEKLAELDRKYGQEGSGGQEAADDQRARDRTVADARAKLAQDVADQDLSLRERNADAQRTLDNATHDEQVRLDQDRADAEQKHTEDIAAAEQKYDDARATAQQQLSDKLAEAEQRRLDAAAQAFQQLVAQETTNAEKLIATLTDPNSTQGKAAQAKQQADEEAAYEQGLADEEARHTKALHEAQNVADLAAEQQRHDLASKNLQAERSGAQGGTDLSAQGKLQADAAKEQADYERRLDEELAQHESNRTAALTDEAKAAERARHDEAQKALDAEHATRLKQLAEQSGLLTDDQKKEQAAQQATLDREHRQRLSDAQDQADIAKQQADEALADALKKAQTVHDDALKKADQEYKDKLDKAQRTYDDARDKAERAHKDALDKAQREHDDAIAKQNQQFANLKQQQADAHADVLAKIAEQYAIDRAAAIQNRDDRFADIDKASEREQANRKTEFELAQKNEAENFKLREDNTLANLQTRISALQTEHETTLRNIALQAEKDVEANNDALNQKITAIDEQRTRDFAKFDQDLKDRFADLLTQFTDTTQKMADKIPDKVNRVLSGAQNLTAGAASNVEGAIPSGATFRPGGKPGETRDEAFNYLVNTGTSPSEAAKITGKGAGETLPEFAPATRASVPDLDQLLADFDAIARDYRQAALQAQPPDARSYAEQQIAKGVFGGDAAAAEGHPGATAGPSGSAGAENALGWAMQRVGQAIYEGFCERFVENAYNTSGRFPSAWAAAQAMMTHPGGSLGQAPRGALVFFRPDGSNGGYGHVGISTGDGKFVSALYTGVALQGESQYWNRVYAGWGEPAFRAFGGPGEAGKPYLVGERTGSPEVFVPEQSGQFHADVSSIFDYDRLAAAIAQAMARVLPAQSPAPAHAPVTVNVRGADPQAVVREISRVNRRQELLDRAVLHGAA